MFSRKNFLYSLTTALAIISVGSLQACAQGPTEPAWSVPGGAESQGPTANSFGMDGDPDCIYVGGQWLCDGDPTREGSGSGDGDAI